MSSSRHLAATLRIRRLAIIGAPPSALAAAAGRLAAHQDHAPPGSGPGDWSMHYAVAYRRESGRAGYMNRAHRRSVACWSGL